MCSSPEGYGQHLEHVALRSRSVPGVGVRRSRRRRPRPRPAAISLDCVRVVAVHLRPRDEKASPLCERPWEADAACAAVASLRYVSRSLTSLSVAPAVCAGRSSGPSTCPQGARGPLHSRYPETCHVSVPEFAPARPQAESPCARALPRHRADRRRRALDRRHRAADLVREHGSPLVVYDEATLRARARAYREAAPDALVVYGTKAFPNVALMRILAEEGIGADVSTLGELRVRPGGRDRRRRDLVVHGNNKSRRGARARPRRPARSSSLDSLEEIDARARPRRRSGRSSASRPGSRRTRTRRSAPATTARSSGCRRRTRSRRSRRASPRLEGPPRPHRLAARATSTRPRGGRLARARSRARARSELGWTPADARPRRRPRRPLHAPTTPCRSIARVRRPAREVERPAEQEACRTRCSSPAARSSPAPA